MPPKTAEGPGLFGGEIQTILQIESQRRTLRSRRGARKSGDIGNPEGPLEAGADFLKALEKGQALLLMTHKPVRDAVLRSA